MRLTLSEQGGADADTVWRRYAQPARWPAWAPQIRSVETEPELRAGIRGRVRPVAGPAVRFVVTAVDQEARTWSWRVQAGPIRLRLDHAVERCGRSGAATRLTLTGFAPVVLAYAPLARRALRRLVRP
ncbi:SRPBCC family protein [Streptomyces sp. NPDC001904]|uniref:SRPBCC family protein n=1 Tax=Streptomyces sp. NPDC001904 TaxID=3154531 RepID=UPI0033283D37